MKSFFDIEAFTFDYESGELVILFDNKETYKYTGIDGLKLAQKFDALLVKAYKQYTREEKEKKRLKDIH